MMSSDELRAESRWMVIPVALAVLSATALARAQLAKPQPAPPPKLELVPQVQAAGLIGQPVRNTKGDVIGYIVNVLIDEHGAPKGAVMKFAGFLGVGNRDVAVDWDTLRFAAVSGHIAITVTLDAVKLKALPEYKPSAPFVPMARQPATQPKPHSHTGVTQP
jgi:hypothetical protein